MRPLPAAALALLLLAAPAPGGDEAFQALRQGFAERMRQRSEPADRTNWVLRVAGFDNADGARLLMEGLGALGERLEADLEAYEKTRKEYEPLNVPTDVKRDNYKTRTELQNRLAQMDAWIRDDSKVLETFRDAFRKFNETKALSTLASEARHLKPGRALETAAEGIAGNPGGMESAIKLAKDLKDPYTQAAALRGLRGRTEDPVFAFGTESLKSESWPVRLEAVLTLEAMNQPRILLPLIQALAKEEGRLREDIRDSLRRLTSQNYDADPEAWRLWWVDNRESIEGNNPTTALFGAFQAKAAPPEKKSVYGIESRSRRIIFIIDTSGSMKEPIARGGTITGLSADELEDLNARKIDIAKKQLKSAIRALEPQAWFNIVAYGTNVVVWKPKMVQGDMKTKNEALAFVTDMEPAGGTWTYGALQEAFNLGGMGVTDRVYDPAADTFYLISDGAPTNNDMDKPEAIDPKIILDAVREWNRLGKIVIHAIAIDPRAGGGRFIDFMRRIAAENKGQYTQYGDTKK